MLVNMRSCQQNSVGYFKLIWGGSMPIIILLECLFFSVMPRFVQLQLCNNPQNNCELLWRSWKFWKLYCSKHSKPSITVQAACSWEFPFICIHEMCNYCKWVGAKLILSPFPFCIWLHLVSFQELFALICRALNTALVNKHFISVNNPQK